MTDWPIRLLIAAVAAVSACISGPAVAAFNCHADPLRHLKSGETRTINAKVKKGAVCSYTFFSPRGTMHGVRILQKPPSAKIIVNGYSLAYSFSQVGTYQVKIQMHFARGPVTINMVVQVLPESF